MLFQLHWCYRKTFNNACLSVCRYGPVWSREPAPAQGCWLIGWRCLTQRWSQFAQTSNINYSSQWTRYLYLSICTCLTCVDRSNFISSYEYYNFVCQRACAYLCVLKQGKSSGVCAVPSYRPYLLALLIHQSNWSTLHRCITTLLDKPKEHR